VQFEGIISRVYMFFGTKNPNLTSVLKPEVKLMMFLRLRSNKIRKKRRNVIKMQFSGLISRVCMFFGTGNPKLQSILKPTVTLLVFQRTRSDKIMKNYLQKISNSNFHKNAYKSAVPCAQGSVRKVSLTFPKGAVQRKKNIPKEGLCRI